MVCTIISAGEKLHLRNKNEYEKPYQMIKGKLQDLIWDLYSQGYDTFCLNCEYGVPLWAAEFICLQKVAGNPVTLNIFMPYEEQYVSFLMGRIGEFDLMAVFAIHKVMKSHSRINCSLMLVLPYQNKTVDQNRANFLNLYDEIEICTESANNYYRSAFQLRNQNMIDRSDLVLCCIEHDSGGAYQTIRYAQQQKCHVINVAKM